jgi:asparagine synthase (glutamine-hydrolysing)
MSNIFGLLEQPGSHVTETDMQRLASITERYGTGASSFWVSGRLGMGFQPYASHERLTLESGPSVGPEGDMVVFDGRLDNFQELAMLLGLRRSDTSDSQIVLSAFERWGAECFSHLTGDWALVLWSRKDEVLYLARDHAGARTLYFRLEQGILLWSTHLDTFRPDTIEHRLAEDYVARHLTSTPVQDLTPYEGLYSVPPAHFLVLRDGAMTRHLHWSSLIEDEIRYKTDAAYEFHFLALFRQAVERRTGSGEPILAQLSGGMDSTAIVCMSDHLRRSTDPAAAILDTVSFYDDSEASLDEKPYFSVTEARRGKIGTHIDTAFSQHTFVPHVAGDGDYLLPGADSFSLTQERRFYNALWSRGYRSVLSGIGGDEVLGGIPTAFPELADYLVAGWIPSLLRQSVAWSLTDRRPLLATLLGTTKYAFRIYADSMLDRQRIPPWISAALKARLRESVTDKSTGHLRLGTEPHRLDNHLAWASIMETLPHRFPKILTRPEYRYPFLDRDLVTYLFSIPREQIVRPGRRRSLMRRALLNIVPREILERRRKAFQLRAPLHTLQQAYPVLQTLFSDSAVADLGFVDVDRLRRALEATAQGDPTWWQALIRTISLELWLQAGIRKTLEKKHLGDSFARLTA